MISFSHFKYWERDVCIEGKMWRPIPLFSYKRRRCSFLGVHLFGRNSYSSLAHTPSSPLRHVLVFFVLVFACPCDPVFVIACEVASSWWLCSSSSWCSSARAQCSMLETCLSVWGMHVYIHYFWGNIDPKWKQFAINKRDSWNSPDWSGRKWWNNIDPQCVLSMWMLIHQIRYCYLCFSCRPPNAACYMSLRSSNQGLSIACLCAQFRFR